MIIKYKHLFLDVSAVKYQLSCDTLLLLPDMHKNLCVHKPSLNFQDF